MSGRHRRGRDIPTHIQDQYQAAEREVRTVLGRTAERIGTQVHEGDNDDPRDPTFNALLGRIRAAADAGRLLSCPHLRGTPQPAFINAWDRPWQLRCLACNSALPDLTPEQDNTCDTCGHYDPEGVWPSQAALGAIVLSFGRCDDCTPEHVKRLT